MSALGQQSGKQKDRLTAVSPNVKLVLRSCSAYCSILRTRVRCTT